MNTVEIILDDAAEDSDEALKKERVKLAEINRLMQVRDEGFLGVLKDGRLVDRRDHPAAMPVKKNAFLGVPTPKGEK